MFENEQGPGKGLWWPTPSAPICPLKDKPRGAEGLGRAAATQCRQLSPAVSLCCSYLASHHPLLGPQPQPGLVALEGLLASFW